MTDNEEEGGPVHMTEEEYRRRPLTKRQKRDTRPSSPDPTDAELFAAHRLANEAARTPEEIARQLARAQEGLEHLDDPHEEPDDLPPAC